MAEDKKIDEFPKVPEFQTFEPTKRDLEEIELEEQEGTAQRPFRIDYENLDIIVMPSALTRRLDINLNSSKGIGGALFQRIVTFTSTDATPTVANANVFRTAGTTAITAFDDGIAGQVIKILADANITITNGASLLLAGAANYAMTANDTLTLCMFTQGTWVETARSVN